MVAQCSYISHILDMTLVCTKLLQPIKPLCKEIKNKIVINLVLGL